MQDRELDTLLTDSATEQHDREPLRGRRVGRQVVVASGLGIAFAVAWSACSAYRSSLTVNGLSSLVEEELTGVCVDDPRSACNVMNCGNNAECITNGSMFQKFCRCKPGFCARVASSYLSSAPCEQPSCSQDTGGTCYVSGCMWNRGPTMCQSNSRASVLPANLPVVGARLPKWATNSSQCICRPGYCASQGHCSLGAYSTGDGTVKAMVVPVTDKQTTFPGNHNNIKTALCISGGGMRSLTLAIGAVRALEHMGVMESIDAISSVSGGAWFSAVYMFSDLSTDALLGEATDPQHLTMEKLTSKPPGRLGTVATTSSTEFLKQITSTPANELWMQYIYDTILYPAGLEEAHGAMMAATEEDVKRIKDMNPNLRDVVFMVPKKQGKVLVMGGTLLAPSGYDPSSSTAVSLQMSPDFSGSPFHPNNHRVSFDVVSGGASEQIGKRAVGGGLVETFAFGGGAPPRIDKNTTDEGELMVVPLPQHAFSLLHALAISSAAFGSALADLAGFEVMVPVAKIWPVLLEGERKYEAMDYKIGDGGTIENAGVLAMIQRGASKLIWLINTDVPIGDKDYCNTTLTSESKWPVGELTNQLYDKFGFGTDSAATGYLTHNKVFPQEDLSTLVCSLQKKKKSGKPVVHRMSHTSVANDWWGIKSGLTVEILYVYNDKCHEFEDMLPSDTKKELPKSVAKHTAKLSDKAAAMRDEFYNNASMESGADLASSAKELTGAYAKGAGLFANFPNFRTTLQHAPEFTSLSIEQANLLAAQSEYVIEQSGADIRQLLGE